MNNELVEAIRHCITKDCVNCPYAIKGCERAMLKDTLTLLKGDEDGEEPDDVMRSRRRKTHDKSKMA